MSALRDLIGQIDNEELKRRITQEVDVLTKQKKIGLVFEEHLPECTPLYDVKVKRGSKVCKKNGKVNDIFLVQNKNGSKCNLPFIIVEIKCKKKQKTKHNRL